MGTMVQLLKEANDAMQSFGKKTPKQMQAFGAFLQAVDTEGALSVKTKELISIAISVTSHCGWCIAFHVDSALKHGATEAEILEAGWVAVLMGGGPSLMYFQLVEKAIKELKAAQ